jgi:hypothetical protein
MKTPTVFALLVSAAVSQAAQPPNVVLVSLDQACADRMHIYGNPRATSPNLDRMPGSRKTTGEDGSAIISAHTDPHCRDISVR